MYKNKTFLAIIPARGGSKRLPNKNILNLAGKPLIIWTIEAALKSIYIDKIVVSSEDDRILNIAKRYPIEPIKRPKELATDTAKSIDIVIHAIKIYNNYDYVVLLQPTSPLRNEKHIDEAIELLDKKKADAIISVCEFEYNPLWSNTLPPNLSMKNFLKKEVINTRSQDLPTFYRLNGAIYICKTKKLLEENTFFIKDNIFAYIMDKKHSVDIDDEFDFKMAELLIKNKF
jgi:CMP-N,N'-diacetyllegionaminic acid synthase